MFKPTNKIRIVYFLIDAGVIFCCFFIPYLVFFNFESIRHLYLSDLEFVFGKEYAFVFLIWGGLIIASLQRKKLYSTDRTLTVPKEAFLVLVSVSSISLLVANVLFFFGPTAIARNIIIASFILLCVSLVSWRALKRMILRNLILNGFNNFNALIIGANHNARLLLDEIKSRPYLGLRVLGVLDDQGKNPISIGLPLLGEISDFEKVCKKHFIDEVFIADSSHEKILPRLTKIARKMHIGIRIIPVDSVIDKSLSFFRLDYLGGIAFLTVKERQPHPSDFLAKRILDLAISIPMLIIISPLMAVIACLIKIDSPGSVFYCQKRTGKKKEIFYLYKFRSMVMEADRLKNRLLDRNEVSGGVIFKIRNDPRVTRVGRFLRRYSLDELPQLFNVIRGDLSLVGPRPFPVEESEGMEFHHMPRLNIKPGITGLAQVKGRSELSFYRWSRLDLWYIDNWSLGLDLKILLWTIPAVFNGKGAY